MNGITFWQLALWPVMCYLSSCVETELHCKTAYSATGGNGRFAYALEISRVHKFTTSAKQCNSVVSSNLRENSIRAFIPTSSFCSGFATLMILPVNLWIVHTYSRSHRQSIAMSDILGESDILPTSAVLPWLCYTDIFTMDLYDLSLWPEDYFSLFAILLWIRCT